MISSIVPIVFRTYVLPLRFISGADSSGLCLDIDTHKSPMYTKLYLQQRIMMHRDGDAERNAVCAYAI
jgi:hypothetical protein